MLLEKVILGITLAAPIGPVSIEMIKRGLNKGFLGAFIVRLGGALGNSLCLVAAYFGASLLMASETKTALCSLAGALVLIYLGIKSVLDKRSHQYHQDNTFEHTLSSENPAYTPLNGLLTGFVLSIANPIGIVFWIGIFAASASIDQSGETPVWLGLIQNFAVIAGVLIWGIILSSVLEVGKRFFKAKWIKTITIVAGIMLIYFGLKYAHRAVLILLPAW